MTPRKPFNPDQFALEYENVTDFRDSNTVAHAVQAYDTTGRYGYDILGAMHWSPRTGRIMRISVQREASRKGLGTAMWKHAQELASSNPDIPQPRHSTNRTLSGELWARKVGGELPPNKSERVVELADNLNARFKKSKVPSQWEQLSPHLIDDDD